eukprot:scaffold106305_cov70-Phaeocystis_antarctica.AAC.2
MRSGAHLVLALDAHDEEERGVPPVDHLVPSVLVEGALRDAHGARCVVRGARWRRGPVARRRAGRAGGGGAAGGQRRRRAIGALEVALAAVPREVREGSAGDTDLRLRSREALADDLRLERTPLVHLVRLIVLRQPRLALLVDHEHEANHAASTTKSTASVKWRHRAVRATKQQGEAHGTASETGTVHVTSSFGQTSPTRRASRQLDSSTRGDAAPPPQLMGREESKEQSKAAQREKETAAHGKKQERKDKVWEKGAKDSTKADASAASGAEAVERKAAAAAQVRGLARPRDSR